MKHIDSSSFYRQVEKIRDILKRTVREDAYLQSMDYLSYVEQYLASISVDKTSDSTQKAKDQFQKPILSSADQYLYNIMHIFTNHGISVYSLGEEWSRDAEIIYQFVKNVQDLSGLDFQYERANVCYNLGVLYIEHSLPKKAYAEFREAAELLINTYEAPEINTSVRTLAYYTFFNLAICYKKLNHYVGAETCFQLAIQAQQNLPDRDDADFVRTLFQLVELYLKLKQTDKAEQLLCQVRPLIEKIPNVSDDLYSIYLLDWCEIMEQQGRYEDVLSTVSICLPQIQRAPSSPMLLSQFLYAEYHARLSLGQTNHCLEILDQLSILTQLYPNKTAISTKQIYQMRAELFDEQGNPAEAIKYFQMAWQKYELEKQQNPFWEISLLTDLSLAYINGTYFQRAIDTAQQCVDLITNLALDQQSYNFTLVPIYTNLGLAYLRILDADKAEYYFFAALNLSKQCREINSHETAKLLINLAWTYLSTWQYDKAAYYAYSARDLLKDDNSNSGKNRRADICQILSVVSANPGNTEDSIRWIDNAICLVPAPSVSLCRSFCLKGMLLKDIDPSLAEEFHQKSLLLAQKLNFRNSSFYLELLVDWLNGAPAVQEEEIDELKEALLKASLPDSYLKLLVLSCIVRHSVILERQADVFRYSSDAILLYEKLVKDAIQHNNFTTIINYKKNIRLFYEVIFLSLTSIHDAEKRLPEYTPLFHLFHYYKLEDYYLLNRINQQENTDSTYRQLNSELNYLNFTANILKEQVNHEYNHRLLMKKADMNYWKAPEPELSHTYAATFSADYEDFWCIDYYCPEFKWFTTTSNAFAVVWQWIRPEQKTLIMLGSTEKIQNGISCFRDAVIRDDSTQKQEQTLYQLLIAPVMEQLPQLGSVHSFIICPDGPVSIVPFETFMGVHNRILYVPFTDILYSNEHPVSHRALVAGNPVITQHNPLGVIPLRLSEAECHQTAETLLSAGYTVQTLCGNNKEHTGTFSRDSLLRCLNADKYEIVHLSTHGFYQDSGKLTSITLSHAATDNPYRRCGILLNDCVKNNEYDIHRSVILGEDIIKLDMSGTQLVVLSTCVSGLGNHISGEWLTGLQRAFLIAGTENIIVSLWEVDEEATALLMSYFYQHVKEKQPLDIALMEAKRELTQYQNGLYSTPFYWAGFIYIGKITVL